MANYSEAERAERDDLAGAIRETPHLSRKAPVIDRLRKIVADKQASRVDGVLVDLFSASVVVQVHDAVNEANRAKLSAMPVRKMVSVCFQVASRNGAWGPRP